MIAIFAILAVLAVAVVAGLYIYSNRQTVEEQHRVLSLAEINKIEDPVIRSIAINEWLQKGA